MVDKIKKNKTKFEMNPEVSDKETKANDIKMEAVLDESITKMSNARLKFHATKDFPHGSYGRKEIQDEHKRRMKTEPNYHTVKPSMNEAVYHVSYGVGLDHQVNANSEADAHQKAMAHFKKTKPKLNNPDYADVFAKKSIHRVTGNETRVKNEEVELGETLSVVGRLAAARKMAKLGNAGTLERGKRKKSFMAMTAKRASGLGWKAARRQIKQKLAKGQDIGTMSAQGKTRIELIANKLKNPQKVLARKLTRKYMAKEDVNLNQAFELMLEGKRYHQLMTKKGTVKFDMRFKHFREKTNPFFKTESNEELVEAVAEMHEVVSKVPMKQIKEAAALKALAMLIEKDSSVDFNMQVQRVSRTFGIDPKQLKETYNELDA